MFRPSDQFIGCLHVVCPDRCDTVTFSIIRSLNILTITQKLELPCRDLPVILHLMEQKISYEKKSNL